MFEYFPDNYPWSMAVVSTLDSGGVASEVDDVCRPLRGLAGAEPEKGIDAWLERWGALGRRLARQGEVEAAAAHRLSAGEKLVRAALYLFVAERQASPRDPRKLQLYAEALDAFRRGVELRGDGVEHVEVPYEGATLPALFAPARPGGAGPCIVHFNGLDSVKELTYLRLAEAYAQRGIASLLVDQPGSGGALRLRGLTALVETERPAAACIDLLTERGDVDPSRIGIQGVSMGGYFAPRAAAFEPRLACCVAFGAFWDFGEVARMAQERGPSYANSVSDMAGQLQWVAGADSLPEAARLLSQFTLAGVAERIRCPLLVVHGARDRQIPGDHARKTYDAAVNSAGRKLVLLDGPEGGVEHCCVDNLPLARGIMADWIADTLRSGERR